MIRDFMKCLLIVYYRIHFQSMKNIILHIGYNKTGTTAIQNIFYHNRKILEKQGVFYPEKCRERRKSPAHHSLAESLLYKINKPLPRFVNTKIYKKHPFDHYWQILMRELSGTNAPTVFISSEAFSRLRGNPAQMQFIKDQLKSHHVRILAYLRSQPEFLESAYNQAVKRGRETRTVDELMDSGWMSIDYFQELEQWASVFGSENMIVRIFNKEMPEGVVADVLKILEKEGLSLDALNSFSKYFKFRWNIRLPNNKVETKRKINARYRLPVFADKMVNLYLNRTGKYGTDVELLTKEQKERIVENYYESNLKLGEKYLKGETPFTK